MILFKLWPIWAAVDASFGLFGPGGDRVGSASLDNYVRGLSDDRFIWGLELTLAVAVIKVPVQLALGLGAAILLQSQTAGNKLARALAVSPVFLGLPVTSLLFAYMFDSSYGLVNAVAATFGIAPVEWFNAPAPAQFVLILLSVWRDLGLTMLVFLAGLAAIPKDILSAAKMDGAGPFALFATMTWPLLRRSVQFAVVLATLASFQLIVPVLILTRGGPLDATNVAAHQIYQQGFEFFDFGQASAMSLVLVLGLLVVVAAELRWLRVEWRRA